MANRGMPSMLALLGLLAVAGYQNRDKIGAALNGLGKQGGSDDGSRDGKGGLLEANGGLGQILSGLGMGGLASGLGDLMNTFREAGQGDVADSWVRPGVPTQGLTPEQVQQAIGDENLRHIAERTGLTREELLQRLATAIPDTVDRLTPNGEMPTEEQARQSFGMPL